jgi:hypothetical protein
LGRGLSGRDMAVVRGIVRDVAKDDYRFSSVVLAVAESVPFREREAASVDTVASVERSGMAR